MDAAALLARPLETIDEVAAAEWNALDLGGVPFVRHEFLAALEHAGCVGDGTGWRPRHVVVRRGAPLAGALPRYE